MPDQPNGADLIPPGSTPTRELLSAVLDALTPSVPMTEANELVWLRDRAGQVRAGLRRFLSGPDNGSAELVGEARILRALTADLPPGARPAG
ncbi:MAG TPA: hypothetical protein VMU94_09445 [Streptosporangiaceae bacterium]|nr:hypothetical protein [Streptosporangiaceae bacterium]